VSGSATTDPLDDAKQLCEKHGGLVIEQGTDYIWDRLLRCHRNVVCWRVYRRLPLGRRTFIGKRRSTGALLALVKKLV
jgi:hypothetical protein